MEEKGGEEVHPPNSIQPICHCGLSFSSTSTFTVAFICFVRIGGEGAKHTHTSVKEMRVLFLGLVNMG